MKSKTKVAVYGSLLSGLGNHRVMQESGGKLLSSTTIDSFKMYPVAGYSFPAIVFSGNKEDTIAVEVYEVEDLRRLDTLEGYPYHYDRQFVKTEDNQVAWVYFQETKPNMEPIVHGDWKKYREER